MKELQNRLKALSKSDLKYLIASLMIDGDLKYEELNEIYVHYLEKKQREKQKIIQSLSIPLSYYWDGAKDKSKQDMFIKCRGAYALLKCKYFHTAPVEKDYEKQLKKHPYSEDERGNPIYEL